MPSSDVDLLVDLPKDAQSILNLAARSLFDVLSLIHI
jgi:hypothetical protein